ncbi:MAG: hypothetical protein GX241_01380 [Ruminococcaceae bacterium]|nr:hypothetical protein [Oscillospiraceae bacterium]
MERITQQKVYKWSATIGLIIGTLCITLFAFFYKLPTIYKYEIDAEKSDQIKAVYTEKALLASDDKAPFLMTSFDNIFYSFEDKEAFFFTFKEKSFEPISIKRILQFSLPIGDGFEKVSVNMFSKDGILEGYGLYSKKKRDDAPYAFMKVVENKITDNADFIVFVDYTIEDFYNNSKSYDAIFVLNSKTKEIQNVFENKKNIIIPIDFIKERMDGFYYFTKSENNFNLYKKNGINSKEILVAKNLILPHAFSIDGDIYLFTKPPIVKDKKGEIVVSTEEGFILAKLGGVGEDLVYNRFSGNPGKYIIKDYFVFNPENKSVFDVKNGSNQVINTTVSIFEIQDFTIDPNGERLILAGTFAGNKEKILFYDFITDKIVLVEGKTLFLSNNPNLSFIGDNVYFLSPGQTADYVTNLVIKWSDIF